MKKFSNTKHKNEKKKWEKAEEKKAALYCAQYAETEDRCV